MREKWGEPYGIWPRDLPRKWAKEKVGSCGDFRDWPICPKVGEWRLGWLQVAMVTLNPHLRGRVEADSGFALLGLSDYQVLKGSQAAKSRP